MFQEKRRHERISMNNRCLVYYGNNEIQGEVIDISEGGIGIDISQPIDSDSISITFIEDDPTFVKVYKNCVYTLNARVVRTFDGVYGCVMKPSADIIKYIDNKKCTRLMNIC